MRLHRWDRVRGPRARKRWKPSSGRGQHLKTRVPVQHAAEARMVREVNADTHVPQRRPDEPNSCGQLAAPAR
jgi:hypothetical protein